MLFTIENEKEFANLKACEAWLKQADLVGCALKESSNGFV